MTALFIRRPVMTALVMIGILFFGTVAYRRLPVSDLPQVEFPTISVNANLPGASPETMASAVAPLPERQFRLLGGLPAKPSPVPLPPHPPPSHHDRNHGQPPAPPPLQGPSHPSPSPP